MFSEKKEFTSRNWVQRFLGVHRKGSALRVPKDSDNGRLMCRHIVML